MGDVCEGDFLNESIPVAPSDQTILENESSTNLLPCCEDGKVQNYPHYLSARSAMQVINNSIDFESEDEIDETSVQDAGNVKLSPSKSDELNGRVEPITNEAAACLTYKRRADPASYSKSLDARPIRTNRGMKRRFPGDESDDSSTRRRARVRSMTEVCAQTANCSPRSEQIIKEERQEARKRVRGRRRGRPSKSSNNRRKHSKGSPERSESKRGSDSNETDVYKHKHQSKKDNVYHCNQEGCDKVFSDAGALYRHARVHGDRPYVCHYDGCNRRFLERSKLKRHFLIHTGEKSFVCLYEGCGKAFSLDFNLRSHMKTHTGDYHECPHEGCEKRYCQHYKLRAHIWKDHSANNTLSLKEEMDAVSDAYANDMEVARKQEKLRMLKFRKEKLERSRESKMNRIRDLEIDLEQESKVIIRIDKTLKKLEREMEQIELDDSEHLSSDDVIEPDLEQASSEEKDILVFAQKLPTVDQGARLVQSIEAQSCSHQLMVNKPSPSQSVSQNLSSSLQGTMFVPSKCKDTAVTASLESCTSPKQYIADVPKQNGIGEQAQTEAQRETDQNSCKLLSSSKLLNLQKLEEKPTAEILQTSLGSQIDRFTQHSHRLLLVQQSEPPVAHLFAFQEQPCLID